MSKYNQEGKSSVSTSCGHDCKRQLKVFVYKDQQQRRAKENPHSLLYKGSEYASVFYRQVNSSEDRQLPEPADRVDEEMRASVILLEVIGDLKSH